MIDEEDEERESERVCKGVCVRAACVCAAESGEGLTSRFCNNEEDEDEANNENEDGDEDDEDGDEDETEGGVRSALACFFFISKRFIFGFVVVAVAMVGEREITCTRD